MSKIELSRSKRAGKKFVVNVNDNVVHFGADGYEDFTMHGDETRKERYIARHKARENWTKSGINTAGFWSRWLLWNKPTIQESAKDIEKRFGVKIILK